MMKIKTRILGRFYLVLFAFICMLTPCKRVYATIIDSDYFGENNDFQWEMSDEGVLMISGKGNMPDFISPPWEKYRNSLSIVNINEGITGIGVGSFEGCISLKKVSIPEGVLAIGDNAFWQCWELREVILPDTLTQIGDYAFSGSGLERINIPENCSYIGESAFVYNWNLRQIDVAENNDFFVVEDEILYRLTDKKKTGIMYCLFDSQKRDVIIEEGVIKIDEGAFYNYESHHQIGRLTFPSTIEYIDSWAFAMCSIDEVVFSTLTHDLIINGCAFAHGNGLFTVTVPSQVKKIQEYTFVNSESLTEVVLNEGTDSILEGAFKDCIALKKIVIPKSVTSIDSKAFDGCNKEILTLYVESASYAESYAKEYGYKYILTDVMETSKSVTASAGVNSATVSWDAVPGAELYALYLKRTNGETVLVNNRLKDTTYTINNLAAGTKIGFVVKAYGNGKWSGWSSTAWATPTAPEVVAPTNVKAVAGNGTVSLTWDVVPGAQLYALFLKKTNGEVVLIDNRITTNSYNLSNLANGTTLGFIVKAYGNRKWSGWSATVWTTPSLPIVAPSNVLATAGNKTITVTWDAVPGAQVYALFLKRANGDVVLVDNRVSATSYTINNLTNGTSYGFVVKAYIAKQWSGWSTTSWAVPFVE